MIRSMTGFGHGEVSNDKNQKVTVEMKSVNHRYCDISLKLPKKLAMFEANIRNIMKEYASRGKIDIYVSYEDWQQMWRLLRNVLHRSLRNTEAN